MATAPGKILHDGGHSPQLSPGGEGPRRFQTGKSHGMSDLEALILVQKSDPILSIYDRGIVSSHMRSYFGVERFCNVGYWEDDCRELGTASRQLVSRLVAAMGEDCPRILDVGCGLGASTAQVKRLRPQAAVTGINLSAFQIGECRREFPQCDFQPMDAARLEFADASFEGVISVEAAFHFNTREAFLRQAFRVLTPGGSLVMADLISHDGPLARQIAIWPVETANRLEGLAEYRALLESIGFEEVRIEDMTARTWQAWCHNIERTLPKDLAEGVITPEIYAQHRQTLPALAASVKHYLQVSARRPRSSV